MNTSNESAPGGHVRWRTHTVIAGMLAVLSLTACSDPVSPDVKSLADAKARWEAGEFRDYAFRYEQFCFCPVEGPIDIEIVSDSIVSATVVQTGEPVEQPSWYPTIDELFDRLQDALEQGPVQFEAVYDTDFGFPTSASVDISEQIADEEYSFTVGAFEPAD